MGFKIQTIWFLSEERRVKNEESYSFAVMVFPSSFYPLVLLSSLFALPSPLFALPSPPLRSSLFTQIMDEFKYKREKSPLHTKSYAFAKRIINMVRYIDCPAKMYSLTNQIFRSGTAVGALVREAEFAQSPSDFVNKLHIALKECNETFYWLNLLYDTGFISESQFKSMSDDNDELIAILISSIKTVKKRNKLNHTNE